MLACLFWTLHSSSSNLYAVTWDADLFSWNWAACFNRSASPEMENVRKVRALSGDFPALSTTHKQNIVRSLNTRWPSRSRTWVGLTHIWHFLSSCLGNKYQGNRKPNPGPRPAWSPCTTRKVPFQFPPVKVIVSRGFCALVRQGTASASNAAAAEAARGPRGSAAAHSGREGQRGLPRRRVLVRGGGQLAAEMIWT